jgi:4-hydroxyphenylpyruvate dioxygenase
VANARQAYDLALSRGARAADAAAGALGADAMVLEGIGGSYL